MKNMLAIASIPCLLLCACAVQRSIVNNGFEEITTQKRTTGTTIDTVAVGWHHSQFGSGVSRDAYKGKRAGEVWNWYNYVSGYISNAEGDCKDCGKPISFSPSSITGFYKYIYGDNKGNNDSAWFSIVLTRYDKTSNRRDTVGKARGILGPVDSYTKFEKNITYTSAAQPDSVHIIFKSSMNAFCGDTGECCYLYLDELKFTKGRRKRN